MIVEMAESVVEGGVETARMGSPFKDPAYVDIDTARVICKVSRRTIYNWIKQGKLAVVRTPSGRVRIRHTDLLVPTDG